MDDTPSTEEQGHWRHPHHDTPDWAEHEFTRLGRKLDRVRDQIIAAVYTDLVPILDALAKITAQLARIFQPTGGTITFTTSEGDTSMTDISVLDSSTPLDAAAAFTDAAGNAAVLNDVPVWASSDETVASVVAADDGLSAVVTLTGKEGASSITVDTVDADGTDIQLQGTVTVTGGAAVAGTLTFTPQA